jgi:hypothetical protein
MATPVNEALQRAANQAARAGTPAGSVPAESIVAVGGT